MFLFLSAIFAYQCLCLCLPSHSASISSLPSSAPSLAFVPYLLFSVREHRLPSFYLSSKCLCSFPMYRAFSDYPLSLLATPALHSDLINFLFISPSSPLHRLLRSLSHPSTSLCCLFNQGAVFTMKAVY